MKQVILDFFSFIRKPKDAHYTGNDKAYKWKVFFTLFLCELALLIFYYPIMIWIDKYVELEEAFADSYNIFTSFFLFVLFVPFLEELFFRYFLRRTGFLKYIFSKKVWHKFYPIFFYSSVVAFGFVHITNYEFTSIWIYVLAPFLVLTQIIGGAIMSYLRIRFNFWLGFMYHALWNFVAFFIIDGSYYLFNVDNIEIETKTYKLSVEQKQFLSISESKIIEYTAAVDTIYVIKANYYNTKEILEIITPEKTDYKGTSDLINLEFTSEKGIPTDSLLHILETEGYIEKKAKTN